MVHKKWWFWAVVAVFAYLLVVSVVGGK